MTGKVISLFPSDHISNFKTFDVDQPLLCLGKIASSGKINSYLFAGVCDKTRVVINLKEYVYYDQSQAADGHSTLGLAYDVPFKFAEDYDLVEPTSEQLKQLSDAWMTDEITSCSECGIVHDLEDQQYELTAVHDSESGDWYCKKCAPEDIGFKELIEPTDLFSAPYFPDAEISDNYEHVETLFCDSSGVGGRFERALTAEQVEQRAAELINNNNDRLYCTITSVGQFQVEVSIYKKVV